MSTLKITGMTAVSGANLDDTALLEVVDNLSTTKKATVAQLRTALGAVTSLTGDVTATGPGAAAATIAARAVTIAKFQAISTARLLGRTTASSGDIEEIAVGSGLTLAAGTLSASAAATVAPSTTLLTQRAFGGL